MQAGARAGRPLFLRLLQGFAALVISVVAAGVVSPSVGVLQLLFVALAVAAVVAGPRHRLVLAPSAAALGLLLAFTSLLHIGPPTSGNAHSPMMPASTQWGPMDPNAVPAPHAPGQQGPLTTR